jgi:GNAT superfamily N-acetyltransferase
VNHFDDAEIERYVEPRPDMIGLIAEGPRQPLGVAHAFLLDASQAEIAVVVANDARRHGIGRLLFDQLIGALQKRGSSSAIGYALTENNAFSRLAQSVGMRPRADGPVTTWSLSVAPEWPRGALVTVTELEH